MDAISSIPPRAPGSNPDQHTKSRLLSSSVLNADPKLGQREEI